MATWEQIQQFVRARYPLAKDDPESFAIDWAFADKRAQRIIVSRVRTSVREWIEFRSAVCKQNEMSPEVALRKNSEFVFGGLALVGGLYVVRYSVQLATLDPDELLVPLVALAETADDLERTFTTGDTMLPTRACSFPPLPDQRRRRRPQPDTILSSTELQPD